MSQPSGGGIGFVLLPRQVRAALRAPVEIDRYLKDIAVQEPSHRFLVGATGGCYQRMVDMLAAAWRLDEPGRAPVRVLDWGAGKGHINYLMRKAGFDVISCDRKSDGDDSSFNQAAPIIHERDIDVVPLLHDIELPFATATFDLVVSFGVLEHVKNDQASLREIRRVLKPGGVFYFCFLPYWLSWTQRLAHLRGNRYHPILYSKGRMRRKAKLAGFRVVDIWHGQLFPKNSWPHSNAIESLDRFLTTWTPLKYLGTNLEGILVAE